MTARHIQESIAHLGTKTPLGAEQRLAKMEPLLKEHNIGGFVLYHEGRYLPAVLLTPPNQKFMHDFIANKIMVMG